MKNYYILASCLLLASCSSFGWNKDKKTHTIDNDTYVTSVSTDKLSYMLTMHENLSKDDHQKLKKLARKLVDQKVGKVVLTPVVSNINNVNLYKQPLKEIKNIFMRAGVSISEIYINLPEINSSKSGIRIDGHVYKLNLPTATRWKYPIGDIDSNKDLPNFGVSYEYNLGSMIANPKDLVDPAPLENMDAQTAINAIKKGAENGNASSNGNITISDSSTASSDVK